MDCVDRIQETLGLLQANNSTVDDITSLMQQCPVICDTVYGPKDFELGGIGVCISIGIATISFLVFGLFQAFISYILSPHASSTIRLIVARMQVLFDTIYGTASFLHTAVIVTCYIRLRSNPGTYERSTIQDLLEVLSTLQTLALITHIIQHRPAKITKVSKLCRWDGSSVWLLWLVTTVARDWLKSLAGRSPAAVISKLCERTQPVEEGGKTYPFVHNPDGGYTWLIALCLGFVFGILIIVLNETARGWFWNMLKRFFGSRITHVIFISHWILLTLGVLVFGCYHYFYIRNSMFSGADVDIGWKWDFAQVIAVLLWLPAAWQLSLAFLVTLKPPRGDGFVWTSLRFSEIFYNCHLGSVPKLEKHNGEKSGDAETPEKPRMPVDEKVIKSWEEKTTAEEKVSLLDEKAVEVNDGDAKDEHRAH